MNIVTTNKCKGQSSYYAGIYALPDIPALILKLVCTYQSIHSWLCYNYSIYIIMFVIFIQAQLKEYVIVIRPVFVNLGGQELLVIVL